MDERSAPELMAVRRRGALPKRLLDIMVSISGIVVLAPLYLIIAAGVFGALGRPILFRQVRPGAHGTPFELLKFRTMRDLRGSDGSALPDSSRITSFGRFLRSTSLDELPELWNVLRGEMSLVGPRPLLMDYLPLYTEEQFKRHEVRPGITGWAQVNGRNTLSWEDRFDMDIWYVQNHTMWLDLKILALTVLRVLQRKGISENGGVTMSKFTGRNGG